PRERLRIVAGDAGVRVVVTSARLAAAALPPSLCAVRLDADAATLATQPVTAPEVAVRGENAAYVLYTSGATGAPKGVVVPHRAVAALVESVTRRYGLGGGDRVLQLSSIGFDLAAEEIFPTLAAGGAVVPWRDAAAPTPATLRQLIAAQTV